MLFTRPVPSGTAPTIAIELVSTLRWKYCPMRPATRDGPPLERTVQPIYSARSVLSGSTRIARHTGIAVATMPETTSATIAPA